MIGRHAAVPPKRLKLVHVVSTLDIGGLEMLVLRLMEHTDRSRFDSVVLCLRGRGSLAPQAEALDATVTSVSEIASGHGISATSRALRALAPDVVHSHNPTPHLHAALARARLRYPVLVHTKHGRNFTGNRKALFRNWAASLLTDRVVCVSQDAADVACDLEHVPRRKVTVIRNGVAVPTAVPARVIAPGVPFRLVCVARLDPVKDHATLIEAVSRLVQMRASVTLDLVGDGPAREQLERQVSALNLGAVIRFHGATRDVAQALSAAHLFVLSSVTEGIPLTVLEAMGAGLPVVATRVGGTPEVVSDGLSGFLVPPRDVDALTRAMLTVMQNDELRMKMGSAGRARVEREFGIDRMVSQYDELYVDLLKSRDGRKDVDR